ncbi:MAG TPA: hypothetical protein VFR47_14895 [Anaerolineales bacterium]|nr:hypothetical protein [Anaerolineales bacterium]
MNTPKWIVVFVLVLALSVPAAPVSAACTAASVALTAPAPAPGLVGGDVSFDIIISVGDCVPGVTGAEIFLGYDHTLVEPPISPMGVAVALPDFFGASNVTIAELLADDPRCPGFHACVHLVAAGPAQKTHSGAAARFHFVGKNVGHACFTVLASTLVDADGFDVPHTIAASNPQCVEIIRRYTVKGKVLRQGTPAIPPGPGTLACSEVNLMIGAAIVSTTFTNEFGSFTLPPVPSGKYTLLAGYSGYLDSGIEIVIGDPGPLVIDMGATTLHGGDVNDISDDGGDGKINILDIGEIISEFGFSGAPVRSDPAEGCADPDEPPDINDNGTMNINDLAIAAGNWGCTGPTAWGLVPPKRCIPS